MNTKSQLQQCDERTKNREAENIRLGWHQRKWPFRKWNYDLSSWPLARELIFWAQFRFFVPAFLSRSVQISDTTWRVTSLVSVYLHISLLSQTSVFIIKIYKIILLMETLDLNDLRPFLISASIVCLILLVFIDSYTIYYEVSASMNIYFLRFIGLILAKLAILFCEWNQLYWRHCWKHNARRARVHCFNIHRNAYISDLLVIFIIWIHDSSNNVYHYHSKCIFIGARVRLKRQWNIEIGFHHILAAIVRVKKMTLTAVEQFHSFRNTLKFTNQSGSKRKYSNAKP